MLNQQGVMLVEMIGLVLVLVVVMALLQRGGEENTEGMYVLAMLTVSALLRAKNVPGDCCRSIFAALPT